MRVKMSWAGVLAAAAIAVPAAHADVYKWVDDNGGVTYGNVPPPGAKKLTQLNEDNGRVSTVPGMSPEELARQRQLALELRLQRLERDLYEQRLRDGMAAAQPYPGYADYAPGYYGYGGWYGAGYFPGYRFPFATRFVRPVRVHPVHPIVRSAPMRGGGRHR